MKLNKKILIPAGILAVVIFVLPKVIGYFVQGKEQAQGETNARFKEIKADFKHKLDLKKHLPFMGLAAIDIDNDGVDELFVSGGENQKDGILKFEGESFKNLGELGLTKDAAIPSFGAASIDVNDDGLQDLFVARSNGVYLYINQGGRFEGKKIEFPLDKKSMPLSIALGDINKDGHVDLYISNYILNEYVEGETIFNQPYGAYSNLLLNNGDNTFKDITKSSGVYTQHNTFLGVFADVDNDNWTDLVVAQDTGKVKTYKNNGDGTFTDMKNPSVFSYPMGIAVGDMDNNGYLDFYFSNVGVTLPELLVKGDLTKEQEFNMDYLYFENKGNFEFQDNAKLRNLAKYGFGWGVVAFDFNIDGLQDFYVSQNYALFPAVQILDLYPGRLIQQYADGNFKPVEKAAGIINKKFGINQVVSDFNNDGLPDIALGNLNDEVRVFLNTTKTDSKWLKVVFPDNAQSIGTRVKLELEGGKVFYNQVYTSEGLASDQTNVLFFGVGKTEQKSAKLTINYQNGIQKETTVQLNTLYKVK